MTAKAMQKLTRFDLDLRGLTVKSVLVNGCRARFTRSGQELRITPRRVLAKGRTFQTKVRYGGVPRTVVGSPVSLGAPYGFVHTDDGAFQATNPDAASTWFPVNDHPLDKARYTFRVTVPQGLGVVANGTLRYQRDRGGRTLWVWDEPYPMAPSLVTADIGHWLVRQGRTPGGIPEYVAVDPALPDVTTTERGVTRTRTALDYFFEESGRAADLWTQTFGPYPFDVVGAIAYNATYDGRPLSFSLETQTKPVYSAVRGTEVIAHELAHQWFGDSVSERRWKDVWLAEGFATFAQYLWGEATGVRTAHEQFLLDYDYYAPWDIVISDPGWEAMFAEVVYGRGAMTLQALREKIGDDAFFRILRTWAARYRYRNASTKDFIALAERVSGVDLDRFFELWLDRAALPASW
jgi:aminopeptidase N